jgi:hypothetical protein
MEYSASLKASVLLQTCFSPSSLGCAKRITAVQLLQTQDAKFHCLLKEATHPKFIIFSSKNVKNLGEFTKYFMKAAAPEATPLCFPVPNHQ